MRSPFFPALLFAFLAGIANVRATEGGFVATLSQEEQSASGLSRLSADQQLALNALVAREVALARQGGVTAFAGTFSSRRRPAERGSAGLDQLSPAELERLNALVAAAIAAAPVPVTTTRRQQEQELRRQRRVEVHGEISATYGRGPGGRDWHGGSVYTELYDRQSGARLGVGLSTYTGDGWWLPDGFHDVGYFEGAAYRGVGTPPRVVTPPFCGSRR